MKKLLLLAAVAFGLSNGLDAQCTISGLNSTYCDNETASTLTGSPAGGVFSGPGISGSTFDPATAGAGTHTITYTYQDYSVAPVPYGPIDISAVGTDVPLSDDQVSGALPIGFSFDFFGNTYTDFYISSNGFITFSSGQPSGCCTGQVLPNASTPNNLIAFAWEDLDPGNGGQPTMNVVRYATTGTAPNRVLVVEFFNVDHFSAGNNVYSHLHLYETSNQIEMHLTSMPSDGGSHTQGIENADGTIAITTPGRNSTNWSATNDAYSYTPVPGSCSTTQMVTVNPTYNTTDAAAICDGDSYSFGTQTLTTAGSYTEVFTAVNGCDSTVVLTLTVNPVYNETDAVAICDGDSYTFGTQTLTTAGSYTELFTSVDGCDSTVVLTLTVNPVYNETDAAAICDGDSYTFGTQTLTTAGSYTEVFTSVDGCDSTVVLTLTVNPVYNETDAAAICDGDSYTFGTQTLTAAGSYTEVFTSVDGCDSTVVLTLTVNPVYNETDAATICDGDSYSFGTQTLTTAGSYTEVFSSISGCDSTVVLTLTVNPTFNETDAATICDGDSYTFGTQTLTAAGSYTEVFTSVDGCDSTVVLTLTVNPVYNETDAAAICDGDSYTFGTQTLTAAGSYTELFTSVDGCDSTVVLTLTVNPLYNETDAVAICDGDSYTFGTQTLTAAGTYTEVFPSMAGCDSTVVLTLTVNPVYNETATDSICTGDSYTFGTQTLTTAGTYTEVFTSMSGCDSTVVLTLTENAVPVITVVSATDEMLGTDGTIDIEVAGGSTYSYEWNGSPSTQDLAGIAAGTYTVVVTDDVTGCTATETTTIDSQVGIYEVLENLFEIYPNPSNGIFNIAMNQVQDNMNIEILNSIGQVVYNSPVTSTITEVNISNVESGNYFVRVITENGIAVKGIVIK
jgi:NH3-dependent NAD+ synthetase